VAEDVSDLATLLHLLERSYRDARPVLRVVLLTNIGTASAPSLPPRAPGLVPLDVLPLDLPLLLHPGKENTPEGGVYVVLYVIVLHFVLYLYFLAPATRDRCGSRKRDGASCLGCTLGTWLCSMSNSIIYHVSCYRFVSQHTYVYHIGPHAHVDTDS
jgi:hypothetical protein